MPKSRNQFARAINDGEKLHQFAVINDKQSPLKTLLIIVQVFCDWSLKLEHMIERARQKHHSLGVWISFANA